LVISIAAMPMVVAEESLTPKEALALEIIQLTQGEKVIEAFVEQMVQQRQRQMQSQISCPAQREVATEMTRVFTSALHESMQSSNLWAELILVYADLFTRDELEGLAEFFSSDLGQKLVESQPEISQRTVKVVQQAGADMQADMREDRAQLVARMKEAGASCEKESAEGTADSID